VTRAIHAAGVPSPAVYDLIEVEGRRGIELERIDGASLLEHTQVRPWSIFGAVRLLAELHARIHRCPAPAGLPSLRERITEGIEASDAPEADKQAARDRLACLPDGTALCHSDFHPGNVLTSRAPGRRSDPRTASRGSEAAPVLSLLRHGSRSFSLSTMLQSADGKGQRDKHSY
jgi:Phosphotransferase enzyme family